MKIDFLSIYTDKLEESISFYTNFLGFSLDRRVDAGGNVTLVFLSDGVGSNIELVDRGEPLPKATNCPVAITIKVDSIYDTEKMVLDAGLVMTFGPMKMPSGVSLLHVQDPNGVTVNFVEMGESEL